MFDFWLQKDAVFEHFWTPKRDQNAIKFPAWFFMIFELFWLPFWFPFGALGPSTTLKKSSWDPPWSSLGRQMLPHVPQMSFLDSFRLFLCYCSTNFGRVCSFFCIKILRSKEHSQRKVKGGRRSFAVGVQFVRPRFWASRRSRFCIDLRLALWLTDSLWLSVLCRHRCSALDQLEFKSFQDGSI